MPSVPWAPKRSRDRAQRGRATGKVSANVERRRTSAARAKQRTRSARKRDALLTSPLCNFRRPNMVFSSLLKYHFYTFKPVTACKDTHISLPQCDFKVDSDRKRWQSLKRRGPRRTCAYLRVRVTKRCMRISTALGPHPASCAAPSTAPLRGSA